MAYSRIKVWIAAEVLTASDLNAEHTGHIANENDLDTRLVAEIATRTTLEGEHDTLQTNLWNSADSQVADNRVGQDSIKDNAVHTAELKTGAVTGDKVAATLKSAAANTESMRQIGTTELKACAGNDARLSDTRLPPNAGVSQAKLKTSQGSVSTTSASLTNLTLPGGEYGFYPRLRNTDNSVPYAGITAQMSAIDNDMSSYSYVTRIALAVEGGFTVYAQQRYVTASGEVHWIFILRDRVIKKVISMYQSSDHPCFGNGGKPLLMPHPFGNYDETKHEIIVINPTLAEIEQMELETIVDDETKPDKDLLEVTIENYEIDEASNLAWPSIPVTVGLPKRITSKTTGKKILVDYRFISPDTVIEPIKKVILKPSYIKVKKLTRK